MDAEILTDVPGVPGLIGSQYRHRVDAHLGLVEGDGEGPGVPEGRDFSPAFAPYVLRYRRPALADTALTMLRGTTPISQISNR